MAKLMIDRSTDSTIDHWLRENAAKSPNKTALNFLGDGHIRYNYSQLLRAVDNTAAVLQHKLGLLRGDRIAFYGKNSDEELILLFAAAALGLIFVPLNWRLAPRELNYITGNAAIRALFVDDHFAKFAPDVLGEQESVQMISTGKSALDGSLSLRQLREQNAEPPNLGTAKIDDPFLIVFTSGTTGRPKGAVHTQASVWANAFASIDAFELNSEDHILNFLPLFHVGGINIQTLPTLYVGGTVTLAEQFLPEMFVHGVTSAKITSITLVPTILRALMSMEEWSELDISSLKSMALGSTDVPTELIDAVHKKGVPVIQIYGATETGPVTIYQKRSEAHDSVGSIGHAGLNTEIRLVADGQDVALGEPGEIFVRAPNCFIGYWDNPTATDDAFADGWFKTGDIASKDRNGFYWFCDRSKNIIISGGENIYPAEIERILSRQPGVEEVAVVGQSDPRWGEVPVAVVIAQDNFNSEKFLKSLDGQIAGFKKPKSVLVTESIPKNAMGKVVYSELKEVVGKSEHNQTMN